MATITTTIQLIDNMSSQLDNIQQAAENMNSTLRQIYGSGNDTAQSGMNGFSFSTFLTNAETAAKKCAELGDKMTESLTRPLFELGKRMFSAAGDHEAAFVGMKKTVEGTEAQYEELNQLAIEMSQNTPMSYTELMGVAQTGGNLGVAIDEMETFMKSYAQLQYATDQHISGESGVQDVAAFLNITEGGVGNIEQFGSSIVHLGNNFNATEDQIISMGNRMASAAHQVNMTTPEILGMATAFTAVGINAEAGGSAASQLISQMALAADVGSRAQAAFAAAGYDYSSALDFSNVLAVMSRGDLGELADSMHMTTDAVKSMADSWLLLEQFADVSGKTSEQFAEDWGTNAAGAMSDFFSGLSRAGEDGSNSVLAVLDQMGLTEIRKSNLIRSMASRPELFANAVSEAVSAYAKNTAMNEEFNKQMDTTASKTAMLGNQFDNLMANYGDNLVTKMQPLMDAVSGILDAFNGLSEVDQDKVVTLLGTLAITGPVLSGIGNTVSAVTSITGAFRTLHQNAGTWGNTITTLLTDPKVWGVAAAGAAAVGIWLLIQKLGEAKTSVDDIVANAANIQMAFDQSSVNVALSQIDQVRAALDLLNPDKATEEAALTSQTVKLGYGTDNMFQTALGYESAVAAANVEKVYEQLGGVLSDQQRQLNEVTQSGSEEERQAVIQSIKDTQAAIAAGVSDARAAFADEMSAVFAGYAQMIPQGADMLENAAKQYDMISIFNQMMDIGPDDANYKALEDLLKANADELGKNLEGYTYDESLTGWQTSLYEQAVKDMYATLEKLGSDEGLNNLFMSMISDSLTMENLDLTKTSGALAGYIRMLDFKSAAQQAVNAGQAADIGSYLVQGLGNSMADNAYLMADPASALAQATLAAVRAAFGISSPSTLMAAEGIYLPQGLARGVDAGVTYVVQAISAAGNAALAAARAAFSATTGQTIGAQLMNGMVAGIRAGAGALSAAMRSAVTNAIAAGNAAAKIHSPSRLTYWSGEMMAQGYAEGVSDNARALGAAVSGAVSYAGSAWNEDAWGNIGYLADLERRKIAEGDDSKIKISDADISMMRELAEREAINRFATAELHIDFTANNTIDSKLDLDEVVQYLSDRVEEQLAVAAESV